MTTMAEMELIKLKERYFALDISSPRYYRKSLELVLGLTVVNYELQSQILPDNSDYLLLLKEMVEAITFMRENTHKDLKYKLSMVEELYFKLRGQSGDDYTAELTRGNWFSASELGDYLCEVRDYLTYCITRQLLSENTWNIVREKGGVNGV